MGGGVTRSIYGRASLNNNVRLSWEHAMAVKSDWQAYKENDEKSASPSSSSPSWIFLDNLRA
jgi:hypothetical protein